MQRESLIEKGYSEEQVTELLDLFHKNNNQTKVDNDNLKNEINKLKDFESKYNDLQKQMEEINKSKMTEQEKIEAEKKEAEDFLNKSKVIYNTAKAKDILAGYDVDDTLINSLVTNDEQSTIANANLLKSKLDNVQESVAKKVREEIANLNAKPSPSNVSNQGDDIMTKDKFMSMSMAEQKKWKDANLDQYHTMFPQK